MRSIWNTRSGAMAVDEGVPTPPASRKAPEVGDLRRWADEIRERCTAIEECYEFMLAYAAQGLASDEGSQSGGQVREYLSRAVAALSGTRGG